MSDYAPIVLVTISLASPLRFASRDYYDGSGNFYKGTLIGFPQLYSKLSDIYYGVDDSQTVKLKFANPIDAGPDDNWYNICNDNELRESWVTIGINDEIDGTDTLLTGKIVDIRISDTVDVVVEGRSDIILETLIPKNIITGSIFANNAKDTGQGINIVIGEVYGVPVYNIQWDTSNNYYDYLIGYGPIEPRTAPNYVVLFRDDSFVDPGEYTFYDGSQASPFPGYAFVRFTSPQLNSQGYPYKFYCRCNGLLMGGASMERNFANVIKEILSNSTWGLGDSVNSTSFSNAATIFDTTYYTFNGCISKQRKARDILNELLFTARGSSLYRNSSGEWEIQVPQTGSSVANFGENDGFYNNAKITSIYKTPLKQRPKTIYVDYYIPLIDNRPRGHASKSIGSIGAEKRYRLNFVGTSTTAKKILSYLVKRATFDSHVEFNAGLEARSLERGDIITIIAPDKPPLESGKDYIVYKINRIISISGKKSDGYQVGCIEYDSSLYGDETISDPDTWDPDDNTVYGPLALTNSLTLGDGTDQPGTITLLVTPDKGDIYIAAGKDDFTNADSGFIFGIDDSDSDKAKLYIGDSSKYLNWDGTNFILKAGNFEFDASGNITATSATITGTITASSGELQTLSITGTLTISGAGKIRVDNGSNYIEMTATSIKGYSDALGLTTFELPSDGSAPTFASGTIKESTIEVYTSGVIRTNANPSANGGLILNNERIIGYNSDPLKLFEIVYDGTDEGDFYVGDYDNNNHGIFYDHSAGILNYRGALIDRTAWESKSADFTAVVNHKYKIDTTTIDVEMTLPAAPADKDRVTWMDVENNFSTNMLTILRNGKKIMDLTEDMYCTNNGESGTLEYDSTTGSWNFPS